MFLRKPPGQGMAGHAEVTKFGAKTGLYLGVGTLNTNEKRVPLASDESRDRSDPIARRSLRAMERPIPLPEKYWPS